MRISGVTIWPWRSLRRSASVERRAASKRLVELLAASDDPVIAYKAGLRAGLDPCLAEATLLREQIGESPMARAALLRVFEQDAKTLQHTYRKWQGPHWTLTGLAMIDHPPGDERLRPLVSRVHDWLLSEHFLDAPLTVVHAGQENRVRHCASTVRGEPQTDRQTAAPTPHETPSESPSLNQRR